MLGCKEKLSWEMGDNGLDWGNYESKRTKSDIEVEYDIVIPNKAGVVWDIWDTEHNEVWIDGKKFFEQKHDYGFCPIALQIVSLGYGAMLLDDESAKFDG